MECTRPECIAAFEEFAGAPGASYAEGGYDWVHCCAPDCHELFWRGKNGFDCAACGGWYCEECQGRAAENENGEDVCRECLDDGALERGGAPSDV